METKTKKEKIFVRLDRGEEVLEKLKEIRNKYNIKNGFFQGVGAVDKVKLGNYEVESQKYREDSFSGSFEVSNFSGNIGPDKIHAHITVADEKFETKAGHCSFARVSGTFEMIILESESPELIHQYDKETGLDIFKLLS